MKQIKYFCNLCNEVKKPDELLNFYWLNTRYELNDNIDSSDKHICKSCIKIIKES